MIQNWINVRFSKCALSLLCSFFLFSSVALAASNDQKSKHDKGEVIYYSNDGVSYTVSKDWIVAEESAIDENGYLVVFETPENKSSGVVTTTWVNYFMDRIETLEMHKKHMRRSDLYRASGIQFSIPDTAIIGNQKAIHMDYLSRVNGKRVEGKMYCLNAGLKTITIFFQTSNHDKEENEARFSRLIETFGVRED